MRLFDYFYFMEKPSDHFKSMDEVKALIDKHKDSISDEEYKTLLIITGLSDQEGDFEEVDKVGNIDISIASIIRHLNNKNYKTNSSCSGISSEHQKWRERRFSGYISIIDDDDKLKKSKIKEIAENNQFLFEEEEVYLKPSYTIRIQGTDEYKKKAWRQLSENLAKELGA